MCLNIKPMGKKTLYLLETLDIVADSTFERVVLNAEFHFSPLWTVYTSSKVKHFGRDFCAFHLSLKNPLDSYLKYFSI